MDGGGPRQGETALRREVAHTGGPGQGILLDDWLEDPPPAAPEDPAGPQRRGLPFGAKAPLARKIILLNLIALGALLMGLLYLTRVDEGLIAERQWAVLGEARAVAQGLAAFAPPGFGAQDPGGTATNEEEARRLLAVFVPGLRSRIRIFDQEGRLLADSADMTEASDTGPESAAQLGLIGRLAATLTALLSASGSEFDGVGPGLSPGLSTEQRVFKALGGAGDISRQPNADGQTIITVALPVPRGDRVVAAVTAATRAGEIDVILGAERGRIMQVFGVAVLISIFLSLVLAQTIANPIRRLAEAAERGVGRTSRLMNPGRIRIPDLTARPDEIGYLSGAMRAMTAALYDRIEAIESFAADVAHEIKNPLTSLRSAVETLRYARTDESRDKLLAIIEKDVIRLDRLLTDISNASRLDSEMVREEMQPFSMTELLQNLVDFHAPKAVAAGGGLMADLPQDSLITHGLEGRLAQVFVNLISNAISFTTDDGVVLVSGQRMASGGVRVTVSDSGPGIPDENLADVFTRFYSERPTRDFGNHSGLGLAISKQIVEAHGGRIWAENIRDPGAGRDGPRRGARFVVELPR